MTDVEEAGIEEVFTWDPPSNQQLVVLALEESRGRNRAEVYRLFARWKRQ